MQRLRQQQGLPRALCAAQANSNSIRKTRVIKAVNHQTKTKPQKLQTALKQAVARSPLETAFFLTFSNPFLVVLMKGSAQPNEQPFVRPRSLCFAVCWMPGCCVTDHTKTQGLPHTPLHTHAQAASRQAFFQNRFPFQFPSFGGTRQRMPQQQQSVKSFLSPPPRSLRCCRCRCCCCCCRSCMRAARV